ncbi:hypothetical protein SLA2020_131970 [Shorea laevis]
MKRMKNDHDGVDRISELPECLIRQIMSYLSPAEVAQMLVVSKYWYSMRATYRRYHFNQYLYYPPLVFGFSVDRILRWVLLEKSDLQLFSVLLFSKTAYPDLDNWVRTLVLKIGVKMLRLDIRVLDELYTLPRPAFFSETLRILKLRRCILDQPLSLFSSLRKLDLDCCRIKLPIILNKGDCPLLEEFVFCCCTGFNAVIHIFDLPKLHTVKIAESGPINELVVSCQSIQSFTIVDKSSAPLLVIDINGCHHLKLLHLQSCNMTDTQFHHLLSKLPLLEELYVFHCYTLEKIKISNPRIKTLVVSLECRSSLKIVEIAAPNLKIFFFLSYPFNESQCRIKVANCCSGLETLVLCNYFATERAIQNLISKFSLLENLWLIGFANLQRIRILNPQLKRLHLVRCFKLKAVKVDGPNLCEFCYIGHESPKFSVSDMEASGGLRFEHSTSSFWRGRLRKMLYNIVGVSEERLALTILWSVSCPPS